MQNTSDTFSRTTIETNRQPRAARRLARKDTLEDELRPETSIEYTLIQEMAVARWRQLRLWRMEKAAMEQQIRKEPETCALWLQNATFRCPGQTWRWLLESGFAPLRPPRGGGVFAQVAQEFGYRLRPATSR